MSSPSPQDDQTAPPLSGEHAFLKEGVEPGHGRMVEDITRFREWDLRTNEWKYSIPGNLPQRPHRLSTWGREANVTLNTYNVVTNTGKAVAHQYDISWGNTTTSEKRTLIKKIWNSKGVREGLGEPDARWIYDGNKLAWCGKRLPDDETRITVDLDLEEGRTPRPDKPNIHTIFVRWTRQVDFQQLSSFLAGTTPWTSQCIDTINFLDHVLREGPSRKYTQIKKSFFQRGETRFDLGGGIEAFKGVFSSLRPVLNDRLQKGLSINVDVANGTFWRSQELNRAVAQVFGLSGAQFIIRFKEAKRDWVQSHMRRDLARFKRVGVTDMHNKECSQQWTIDEITKMDCTEASFTNADGTKITVQQYFKEKYNIAVLADCPVVKMTKKIRGGPVYLPMEFLKIDANQRYNTKLSDTQTSQMIKFAVTLPAERRKAVEFGVKLLDWGTDPFLRTYGIKVNPNPSVVKARILPPPQVYFGNRVEIPARDVVAGRWRLDGKKFVAVNDKPNRVITAWGICILGGRTSVTKETAMSFAATFVKVYEGHGGKFAPNAKVPFMIPGNLADGGDMIAKAFNQTGNHFNGRPTIVFFVVNDRNVEVYRRIKKSCDCRFGVPSQIVQGRHVQTASPQYISNVCLKVNAKLGGCTTFTKSPVIDKVNPNHKSITTMVVGADVSHPAPGAGSDEKASFAAITMASDPTYTRYWAECQTNGNRVEMVTSQNIFDYFGKMAKKWMDTLNTTNPPQRVLYIRDGVSEGQYAAVLEDEVRDMKETFVRLGCKTVPKFTVVIAGKRHHIRFFPEKGDRNGNPIPGTLVETGCTHPFEFDFYLCSHVAIKGTARPIHYQCILNEGEWEPAELQSFLFEHSFQYVRSTTPVSLHPAVYYAHLAADRSRAHQNEAPVSSGKKEQRAKAEQKKATSSSKEKNVEAKPLVKMNEIAQISNTMWFV